MRGMADSSLTCVDQEEVSKVLSHFSIVASKEEDAVAIASCSVSE